MTDSMIYLNGRDKPSYRCQCGCNVFHEVGREAKPNEPVVILYNCNACGTRYRGVAQS